MTIPLRRSDFSLDVYEPRSQEEDPETGQGRGNLFILFIEIDFRSGLLLFLFFKTFPCSCFGNEILIF